MEKELKKRILHYQELFGLTNWCIDLKIENISVGAKTLADPKYYEATITISPALGNKKEDWDAIIIHEMIHIVMALYDFYADNLGKEGSQELFYIAREHSVSQLSHILLRIINNKESTKKKSARIRNPSVLNKLHEKYRKNLEEPSIT